jgi:integrase
MPLALRLGALPHLPTRPSAARLHPRHPRSRPEHDRLTPRPRVRREDLVARNVAKLVVVPGGSQPEVVPLSGEEARALLSAAEGTRPYALWAVALAVGLRRGEALGLRWKDVDLDRGELRVSQTLRRVDGRLQFLPPRSERSRRRVPLPSVTVAALKRHRMQATLEAAKRGGWIGPDDLVFTSSIGTPLEPRNANRAFRAAQGRRSATDAVP